MSSFLRLFLAGLAALCVTFAAGAQTAEMEDSSEIPPEYPASDGSVDLLSGLYSTVSPGVSIGDPGAGGLSWAMVHYDDQWRHSVLGGVADAGTSRFLVSVLGGAESFQYLAGAWQPVDSNGSSLSFNSNTQIYTYTMRDGTVATFHTGASGYGYDVALIDTITFPNGLKYDYHYVSESFTYSSYEACYDENGMLVMCEVQATFGPEYRLQSVTSNTGYQLHFEYNRASATNLDEFAQWLTLEHVRGINNAVDYCAPTAHSCSFTRDWPRLDLTNLYDKSLPLIFTDNLGRQTRWTRNSDNRITAIRWPSSSSNNVTISYDTSFRVSSVAVGSLTTGYAYADASGVRTTTTTHPGGAQTRTEGSLSTGLVTARIDARGQRTSFAYDTENRLKSVTAPEGNSTEYTYDTRGNITEVRQVDKPNSSLADLVTSATYPSSCSNAKTCNQPLTTTDTAGQVTDYTYSATHGGVLTVTLPAPSSGADRPQTRVSYAARYAYYKNSAGTIVQAASAVTLPTEVSRCMSGTSPGCVGTTNEQRTLLTYGSTGVANNLAVTIAQVRRGDGSLNRRTDFAYDHVGRILTVDGPLSGTGDLTRYRYDAAGQLVGTVGPDPDGGGSQLHAAERLSYDLDGRVTQREFGTVTSQSDSAWTNFSRLDRQTVGYDGIGRPTIARAYDSADAVAALVQYSYNNAGRTECVAQRMNPSAFASPPSSACSLGTAGSFGSDRITRTTYDADGRVLTVTEGYGTGAAGTAASYAWSNNGQMISLTDGEGNRTQYLRDGFDRLASIEYPHPSIDGSNTGTDDEIYTYAANGRLASRRVRTDQVFTYSYDNLGRITNVAAPSGTASSSYTYDLFDQVKTVSAGGETLTNSYDALGQLLSQAGPNGTVSYQYDSVGRRTRLTWPDGFYVTYSYDTTSRLTHIRENGASSGVGVLATFAYDSYGRRTSLTRGNGTVTNYAFDAAGRLDQLTQNLSGTADDLTLGFDYNPAGQITSNTRSNTAYSYVNHINLDTLFGHNGLNQIASVTNQVAPAYDGRGNLTSYAGKTYSYDYYNRLTAVSGGVSLSYDPLGRMDQFVSSVSGTFNALYDGAAMIAFTDTAGNVVGRYVHGPGMDEPLVQYSDAGTSTRTFLHADERGSIIAHTDSAGNRTATLAYDEYGNPASSNTGLFQYTGQIWFAEIGLYHYKNRQYHPGLGRFMQTDPIGQTGGVNLYAYVGGDPVNFTDPWGLSQDTVTTTCPTDGPIFCPYGQLLSEWLFNLASGRALLGGVHYGTIGESRGGLGRLPAGPGEERPARCNAHESGDGIARARAIPVRITSREYPGARQAGLSQRDIIMATLNSDPAYYAEAIDIWNRGYIDFEVRDDRYGSTHGSRAVDIPFTFTSAALNDSLSEVQTTILHELGHHLKIFRNRDDNWVEQSIDNWAYCHTRGN